MANWKSHPEKDFLPQDPLCRPEAPAGAFVTEAPQSAAHCFILLLPLAVYSIDTITQKKNNKQQKNMTVVAHPP